MERSIDIDIDIERSIDIDIDIDIHIDADTDTDIDTDTDAYKDADIDLDTHTDRRHELYGARDDENKNPGRYLRQSASGGCCRRACDTQQPYACNSLRGEGMSCG